MGFLGIASFCFIGTELPCPLKAFSAATPTFRFGGIEFPSVADTFAVIQATRFEDFKSGVGLHYVSPMDPNVQVEVYLFPGPNSQRLDESLVGEVLEKTIRGILELRNNQGFESRLQERGTISISDPAGAAQSPVSLKSESIGNADGPKVSLEWEVRMRGGRLALVIGSMVLACESESEMGPTVGPVTGFYDSTLRTVEQTCFPEQVGSVRRDTIFFQQDGHVLMVEQQYNLKGEIDALTGFFIMEEDVPAFDEYDAHWEGQFRPGSYTAVALTGTRDSDCVWRRTVEGVRLGQ